MTFEEYLISKKIDASLFEKSEPNVFSLWKQEFEEMHPNSFTVQKLNLINPIRRKYQLPLTDDKKPEKEILPPTAPASAPAISPVAKPGKPIIKPKPKIN